LDALQAENDARGEQIRKIVQLQKVSAELEKSRQESFIMLQRQFDDMVTKQGDILSKLAVTLDNIERLWREIGRGKDDRDG
jgi:hypothetical protein